MRNLKDKILNTITYLFSSFGILVLVGIIYFIFSNGFSSLSIGLLTSDYYEVTYNTKLTENFVFGEYENPNLEGTYFSSKWGFALKDDFDKENNPVVFVAYIDKYSPLNNMLEAYGTENIAITDQQIIVKVFLEDEDGNLLIGLAKDKAKDLVATFDKGVIITDMITSTSGGGIRGSLLTTLYLIVLTLIIALPLGIGAAVYLNEFALNNKFTRALRSMIEMTSGIPSIIFGFVGAIVFIPFMNKVINSDGGSIASGALTLSIILLPVIIRTTEEGLKVIPTSYRNASLALGASETQTTFKVILPNALGGILAATLLSTGRIIGESAALIYAMGTVIKDDIAINQKSTSLAVHIWTLMSGENPNFEVSSAISIVILIMVLTLSILVKLITKKMNKYGVS